MILIYGGTFDPPHRGHVELPPQVAARLGCDAILYVPAAVNPLKGHPPASGAHRLAMLELAIRDIPAARCSTIELDREGPSYTVDTLQRLRDELGEDEPMRLLMGMDAAISFPLWREPERILELATPAVMARPGWDAAELPDERWPPWVVTIDELPIESSEVRRRLREGEDVSDLVPAAVLAYIREHDLYTASHAP